ncbi:MAG TPA: hypothetical protein VJ124_16990 [Pyrinomonadaceae bacterium]|nr:hypothetical protein [Pyrinomonadaceae bacterium]
MDAAALRDAEVLLADFFAAGVLETLRPADLAGTARVASARSLLALGERLFTAAGVGRRPADRAGDLRKPLLRGLLMGRKRHVSFNAAADAGSSPEGTIASLVNQREKGVCSLN